MWLNDRTAANKRIKLQDETYTLTTPLPHDELLERALLGAIMLCADTGQGLAALREIQFVTYRDFYFYRHGLIYRTFVRLAEKEIEPDYTAVLAELSAVQTTTGSALVEIGGDAYLLSLLNVHGTNTLEYGKLLAQNSLYRASVAVGSLMMDMGNQRKIGLSELMLKVNRLILEIQQRVMAINGQNARDFADLLPQQVAQVQADIAAGTDFKPGIATGFSGLDKVFFGWRKQRLYVVGGSTGMGKSAFMLSSALQAYRAGLKVLFISLELTQAEIVDRLVCNMASLDSERYQTRQLLPAEMDRLETVLELLGEFYASGRFTILCLNSPTLTELAAQVEILVSNGGYDLLFLDYAGWNTISDNGKHRGNTVTHTGEIWNTINTWKKTYDLPIIVGCQISRDHEKRKDKRPVLSDLSDSSMIEKNADGVLFLFRPDKYEEFPENPGRAEAIIRKNRSGRSDSATGTVYLHAELHYNRFSHWNTALMEQFKRDLEGRTFDDL
jgi:replicative DNA helicase